MPYHNNQPDPTERMFERLSKNPDVERGLHRLENNPNEDPALRQMARAVLEECEEGRKRREERRTNAIFIYIGLFLVGFVGTILLLAHGAKNRYH